MQIIQSDCLDHLKTMPEGSVDLIATDPPYGYAFMGKDWDKAVPSVAVWRECLRVLKPGAFCFVMSAPRQDVLSRMMIRLEDAGFKTDFTSIYWCYASGFPKASNIGKMVDKRMGVERTEVVGKSRYEGRRPNKWGGDKHGGNCYGDYQAQPTMPIFASVTPQAKSLDGSYGGFQPKPAVEVIIVCMKPLSEKTYVDQALGNRKGITWLDDCRVPYESEDDVWITPEKPRSNLGFKLSSGNEERNPASPQGRFPANLLVSGDVLNDGVVRVHGGNNYKSGKKHNWVGITNEDKSYVKDSGSFSRYFSLDAWWAERIKELSPQDRKTFPFIIEPKASKGEKNEGLGGFEEKVGTVGNKWTDQDYRRGDTKPTTKRKNIHPTVKPVDLFSYLITLGSREGDLVLDPFCGSGTTGIAAKLLHRDFIGIDNNADYCEIARARLLATQDTLL